MNEVVPQEECEFKPKKVCHQQASSPSETRQKTVAAQFGRRLRRLRRSFGDRVDSVAKEGLSHDPVKRRRKVIVRRRRPVTRKIKVPSVPKEINFVTVKPPPALKFDDLSPSPKEASLPIHQAVPVENVSAESLERSKSSSKVAETALSKFEEAILTRQRQELKHQQLEQRRLHQEQQNKLLKLSQNEGTFVNVREKTLFQHALQQPGPQAPLSSPQTPLPQPPSSPNQRITDGSCKLVPTQNCDRVQVNPRPVWKKMIRRICRSPQSNDDVQLAKSLLKSRQPILNFL